MKSCVNHNGKASAYFNVKSGIPKGGLFICRLCNFIMDNIIHSIDNSKLGCFIGGRCASVFTYSDDLIILSCSVTKLELLLNLCVDRGRQFDMVFNTDKIILWFYW